MSRIADVKKSLPEDWLEEGETLLLAETIENMEVLFEEIKIGKKKSTFEDLLAFRDARTVIIEIADELVSELFLSEKKSVL